MSTSELVSKAKRVAEVDFEINGNYINQPYEIHHNGETYKAFVRTSLPGGAEESQSSTRLEIVRPASIVASEYLPNKASNNGKKKMSDVIRVPSDEDFRKS